MEDHNKSLKRKRLLSTSSENHGTDPVVEAQSNELAETMSSTCYGTVM